jgi:predicted RNA-binding protein with PIN domain
VSELTDYPQTVAAYTKGRGRLQCALRGYEPCHNASEVIAAIGYEAERDTENPADSVFCAHGGGFVVPWQKVPGMAHVESGIRLQEDEPEDVPAPARRPAAPYPTTREEEAELTAIFERTYGQVKRRDFRPTPKPREEGTVKRTVPPRRLGPEYLLVDGYNIIFAWDELKALAAKDLSHARGALMDLLCNYQGFKKNRVILVFDAYKVKGNPGAVEKYRNIHVVYTKEAETADNYIERATYDLAKEHTVRVATSDNLEQLIILGHGAVRVSALDFKAEVEAAEGRIAQLIEANNRQSREDRKIKNQAIIRDKKKDT